MRSIKLQSYQQGVTLIVVLMVLLLISIIGVIAVRQSSTDLAISTNAQVRKLLFQSNDAALAKIEQVDRNTSSVFAATINPLAYATNNQGDDIIFCIDPRKSDLFNALNIPLSVRSGNSGDGYKIKGGGACNPAIATDFIGERRAVMTQVNLVQPPVNCDEAFCNAIVGSNSKALPGGNPVVINATSVIPAYAANVQPGLASTASNDTATIAGCMQQAPELPDPLPATPPKTIDKCLNDLGAVSQTQQQDYIYRPKGVKTVGAG